MSTVAVSLCYCRHKMDHVGRACDAPRDNLPTCGSPPEKPPPDIREVVRVPVDREGREIEA